MLLYDILLFKQPRIKNNIECSKKNTSNVVFLLLVLYFINMSMYINRPLANEIKKTAQKVIILEGARAVGKTMMAKTELSEFHYESLADSSTYHYAKYDLSGWLQTLPIPTIIDEAQLIPELPLAVKEIVDRIPQNSICFILTGSASITRNGLNGQDPLTRRSRRFSLNPLTRREINMNTSQNVVDMLWSKRPNARYESSLNQADILRYMSIGGFPAYVNSAATMSKEVRRRNIKDDIDNVLGDTILPDEKLDSSIARVVLKELLATPGGIINLKRTGDLAHIDPRTVERYISIFERRFLVRILPNLKTAANRQTIARSKIHPADSAFAIEILLQSGKDISENRVLYGQVFESFVVNQIISEIDWSKRATDVFYWREAGNQPREVDLVLVQDNELIGVEVKSNIHVDRTDFAGLAKLKNSDSRFVRGYVVYQGTKPIDFGGGMWAIPLSALWDYEGFEEIEKYEKVVSFDRHAIEGETHMKIESDNSIEFDANIFLSYRHSDNDYLQGAILKFKDALMSAYEYKYGHKLRIFTDQAISWGSQWQDVLDENIEKANILLAAITPRYMRSEPCIDELLGFSARVSGKNGNRILPLIWQSVSDSPGFNHDSPAWKIISDTQRISVEDLAYKDTQTLEYKKRMADIAQKLHDVIVEQNEQISTAVDEKIEKMNTEDTSDGKLNVLERMSELENQYNNISEYSQNVQLYFSKVASHLNSNPLSVNPSATDILRWSVSVASQSRADVEKLDQSISEMVDVWNTYYEILVGYIDLVGTMPDGASKNEQISSVLNTLEQLHREVRLDEKSDEVISTLRMLGSFAKPLYPLTSSFEKAYNFIKNVETQVAALEQRARRLQQQGK